ncbi:MAG: type II secretion system protein M, partial [Salinisphaera sp.]|nr:type II secretion system protein M [Salinisphaera sp.]
GKQSFAAWMTQIEAEAAALRQQGGRETIRGRGDSLLAVVDQTSRDAGLSAALQRIQPQGQDKATVTLDDAGFDKLLRWLRTLEQSYGIVVQALSVTREDKPGTVQARLTLQRSSG